MKTLARQFVDYVIGVAGEMVTCGDRALAGLPQYLAQQYGVLDITVGHRRFLGVELKNTAEARPTLHEKHLQQILARKVAA